MRHDMSSWNTAGHAENDCGIWVCGMRNGVTVPAGQSPLTEIKSYPPL